MAVSSIIRVYSTRDDSKPGWHNSPWVRPFAVTIVSLRKPSFTHAGWSFSWNLSLCRSSQACCAGNKKRSRLKELPDSLMQISMANRPELSDRLVPGAGIEPARRYAPRDFKSLASTYSATQATAYGAFSVFTVQCQYPCWPLPVNR